MKLALIVDVRDDRVARFRSSLYRFVINNTAFITTTAEVWVVADAGDLARKESTTPLHLTEQTDKFL